MYDFTSILAVFLNEPSKIDSTLSTKYFLLNTFYSNYQSLVFNIHHSFFKINKTRLPLRPQIYGVTTFYFSRKKLA